MESNLKISRKIKPRDFELFSVQLASVIEIRQGTRELPSLLLKQPKVFHNTFIKYENLLFIIFSTKNISKFLSNSLIHFSDSTHVFSFIALENVVFEKKS